MDPKVRFADLRGTAKKLRFVLTDQPKRLFPAAPFSIYGAVNDFLQHGYLLLRTTYCVLKSQTGSPVKQYAVQNAKV